MVDLVLLDIRVTSSSPAAVDLTIQKVLGNGARAPPRAAQKHAAPKATPAPAPVVSMHGTESPTQRKVRDAAIALGLNARMHRVQVGYYDRSLEERQAELGAPSTAVLCKSMILENTRLTDERPGRLKNICVVLQYAAGKIHRDKLVEAVRKLEGAAAIGKKHYNFRLVDEEESLRLSGYNHNAVSPIGLAVQMPLILSAPLRRLPGGEMWLGAGEADLKVAVDVEACVSSFEAAGWNVSFADCVHHEQ